jgi:hypothetical protein
MTSHDPSADASDAEPTAAGLLGAENPVVRRLESASAAALGGLVETFEELQMVLRCCERLVSELAEPDGPDAVVVEAVWTMALLSYVRCFSEGPSSVALTEKDLKAAQPGSEVLEWHQVLLQLRDHYADPAASPRERFTVAVTQDAEGAVSGVAITSARQPLVDDVTVRQTGAVAYSLSGLLNERIESQQRIVSDELEAVSRADLEKLDTVAVVAAAGAGT